MNVKKARELRKLIWGKDGSMGHSSTRKYFYTKSKTVEVPVMENNQPKVKRDPATKDVEFIKEKKVVPDANSPIVAEEKRRVYQYMKKVGSRHNYRSMKGATLVAKLFYPEMFTSKTAG